MNNLSGQQREICKKYSADFVEADGNLVVGVAENLTSEYPLNGLRHPIEGNTSGWYLWGGEELSEDPNFFKPMHIKHLIKYRPEVMPYLGLAPGWRFLIDPTTGYQDVWFDENLLNV